MNTPIGVSDFGELRKYRHPTTHEGYTYIDKSLFIKEILDDPAKIILLTRPRRFGKTLNLSMLEYFFAKEIIKEPTKDLFTGLNISNHQDCMDYQGKYPVIFMSFKDIEATNFSSCIKQITTLIRKTYKAHQYLFTSASISLDDLKYIKEIINRTIDTDDLQDSLYTLIRLLYEYHNEKPILLIDEYDTPLHYAYTHGYYENLINFLRNLLSAGLRDNRMLNKAVLTGILRISKESLFSGLSHMEIYSLLDKQYAKYFGFTEEETTYLLEKASLKPNLQEIKSWYNGYNFGDLTIYNPWSILKCIKQQGELKSYWINTSGNELLKHLIINSRNDIKEDIERLIQGETITAFVDEHIVFADLNDNPSAVWSLLLLSGYLKYTQAKIEDTGYFCSLTLPNKEIQTIYVLIIKKWLDKKYGSNWQKEFLNALLAGDIPKLQIQLQSLILETVSCHDVNKKTGEIFYHGLMLGLVSGLKDSYFIHSNKESGLGRYDIALIPKDHQQPGVVSELKVSTSFTNLGNAAATALEQITTSKYTSELQNLGVTVIRKIGLAFNGKDLKISGA